MSRIHRRNPRHGRRRAERARTWLEGFERDLGVMWRGLIGSAARAESLTAMDLEEIAARWDVPLPPKGEAA